MLRWLKPLACALLLTGTLYTLSARADPPPAPAASDSSASSTTDTAVAAEPAEPEEPAPAATDSIARRILQNFIIVAGGVDALKHIALIQATGTEYPLTKDAVPFQFTYWIAPPNRARLDTVQQEKYGKVTEIHQAVIGDKGWTFEASAKNPFVDDVPATKLPQLVQLADFIYPYTDYDARGLRYQYAGQEKFRGLSALVVKAWPAKGPPAYLYFDPNNFLLLRIRRDARIGDSHTWSNTYFTKYEKVGGFWFPTTWEYALSDAVYARTQVDHIQLFPQADATVFAEPVVHEIVLRQATAPTAAAPDSTSVAPTGPGPVSP
jgi:hypothetical protein